MGVPSNKPGPVGGGRVAFGASHHAGSWQGSVASTPVAPIRHNSLGFRDGSWLRCDAIRTLPGWSTLVRIGAVIVCEAGPGQEIGKPEQPGLHCARTG